MLRQLRVLLLALMALTVPVLLLCSSHLAIEQDQILLLETMVPANTSSRKAHKLRMAKNTAAAAAAAGPRASRKSSSFHLGDDNNPRAFESSTTSTTQAAAETLTRRGRLYNCGNVFPKLNQQLFPEYEHIVIQQNGKQLRSAAASDLLVLSHGWCSGIERHFAGRAALFINGESRSPSSLGDSSNKLRHIGYLDDGPASVQVFYGAMMLASVYHPRYSQAILQNSRRVAATDITAVADTDDASQQSFNSSFVQGSHYKRRHQQQQQPPSPRTAKQHFMIYAASNCVAYREEAAARLSQIGVVHLGGKCTATRQRVVPNTNVASKRVQIGTNWQENPNGFRSYRFCLVLENRKEVGYITEKIINAFASGCIPIYYGTTQVFDVFHKDSFIYYDIENPTVAIKQVQYLERNATAYDNMWNRPILANGNHTLETYFSLSDDIGQGKLKRRIRTLMGIDTYS